MRIVHWLGYEDAFGRFDEVVASKVLHNLGSRKYLDMKLFFELMEHLDVNAP